VRVFLAGQKYFGQEVYKLLRETGHDIVGVSSPAFRDERDRLAYVTGPDAKPDRLRAIAELNGTPWMEAGTLRAETMPEGVDLIIAAHSHDFIGRVTRNRAALGAIGYHPSLLPIHRGRDAVRWAVRLRERVTGGTVFWLNDTVDGGPVAAQEHVLIDPKWTPEELWREALQPIGIKLLRKTLSDISRRVIVRVPQDPKLATWEPSLNPPPLYRPDLPQIGWALDGYRVVVDSLDTLGVTATRL